MLASPRKQDLVCYMFLIRFWLCPGIQKCPFPFLHIEHSLDSLDPCMFWHEETFRHFLLNFILIVATFARTWLSQLPSSLGPDSSMNIAFRRVARSRHIRATMYMLLATIRSKPNIVRLTSPELVMQDIKISDRERIS